MLRSLLAAVLGLMMLSAFSQAAPRASAEAGRAGEIGGRRVALVVGNGAYRNVDRLANPGNDARLMADTLRKLGFTLVGGGALLDLDRAQLAKAVQDFGHTLAGADVGLFYYSGHGLQVQGVNWLVPVDANPTRPQDLDFQMVDADLVLRQMDGAGTRLNLVLLDACRNNPFAVRGLRAVQSGLAEMRAPEGTLISYATQPGNVAADGNGMNSPYTTALAETMQQPGVDIFRLFNTVGLQVKRSTGGVQQPWVSNSPIDGDFFFAGPPAAAPQEMAALARPVAPAVPPAIDPLERLRGLARSRKCSVLDIREEGATPVVRGITLGGQDWNDFLREAGATRGIRVMTPEIEFVQPFACPVVDLLASSVRAGRDIPGPRQLGLARNVVAVGDTLPVVIHGRANDTILLDAYQPDGTVEHMAIPNERMGQADLHLSVPRLAGKPGPRLLASILAAGPIDLSGRAKIERADFYLAALTRALASASEVRSDLAMITLKAPAPAAPSAAVPSATPRSQPPSRPPRCSAIMEREQLGEPPSESDRAFLQSACR
jgi:hypothetical protein